MGGADGQEDLAGDSPETMGSQVLWGATPRRGGPGLPCAGAELLCGPLAPGQ